MTRPSFILYVIIAWLPHRGLSQDPENWLISGRSIQGPAIGLHCQGAFPPGAQYLLSAEQNPYFASPTPHRTYTDLLSVCARFDWGGAAISAGAICLPFSSTPDLIMFDKSERPFSPINMDLRLALYCRTHCWCTGGRRGAKNETPRQTLSISVPSYYYMLDTDIPTWYYIYNPYVVPSMKFTPVEFISWSAAIHTVVNRHQITGPGRNRISCVGPVAPFLNHPYGPLLYNSLQELCAAGQYGGSTRGNFGGTCGSSKGYPEVDFSDEFAHPLSKINMALQLYCFANCQCSDTPTKESRVLYGFLVDRLMNDNIVFRYNDREQRPIGILDVEPSSSGSVTVALRQCSTGPGNSCVPQPLDTDNDDCKYGACLFPQLKLGSPGNSRVVNLNPNVGPVRRRANRHRPPVLREWDSTQEILPNTCSSNPCTGSESCGDSCVCRVGSAMATAQQAGLDRIFANAICSVKLLPGFDILSGLGKRDGEAAKGAAGACACNTTYVSTSCCNSENGLVWEAPQLRLGRLATFV